MNSKIRKILATGLLIAYLVAGFGFANRQSRLTNCEDVNIHITDSLQHRFVHHDDMMKLITHNNINLLGQPLGKLNTHKLEQFFGNHPYIQDAQVYSLGNGALNIELTQRAPIVRIINKYNESFYIDQSGYILPTSNKYTAHLLVINGTIPDRFSTFSPPGNIHSSNKISKQLKEAFELAEFINNDPFWSSQVVQIYALDNKEFEIIPRIGPHIIELGTVDNFHKKFQKLKVLYLKGFNNTGWNDYLRINLKYDNQIICSKS